MANPNWKRGSPSPNPLGRPRNGDSLIDIIQAEGRRAHRKEKMAEHMWGLALNAKPDIAIRAADWIAKHGYNPLFAGAGTGQWIPKTVIFELQPSGDIHD